MGLLPWGSNYTFLTQVFGDGFEFLAVYKPQKGERPLWDFPQGTLCLREYASYLVSEVLGWSLVPATVLRHSGPHGFGALQLYIDADPDEHYFTLREEHRDQLRRIALFDLVINNADRKGGHCLVDDQGHIWSIDHGITFHRHPKLRTVIWDYAREPIPDECMHDLAELQAQLIASSPLHKALSQLLSPDEIQSLSRRVVQLLHSRTFPDPSSGRNMPWPPI